MLLDNEHPLAGVKDVFNAIFVRGNMIDETMFYGKGAESFLQPVQWQRML